jgi:DnaK suppressor protein
MPSKKPIKPAKRAGKATPKKAAHKAAASKKVVRPPAKPMPSRPTSKVTVKPNKPAPKPIIAKPLIAKTVIVKPVIVKPVVVKPVSVKVPRPKPEPTNGSSEKVAPIKFDTRPLVMTRVPPTDEEGDGESAVSASLLAGPRNVKPYIARRGEQYMNKEQLEHFARILQNWKRDLMVEVDRTVLHMKDEAANFPDPNDRATQEEEFSLELRTRDRERKLIRKIDEALKRIEDGSYGYCLETGEEIGIKRLEARPVATLSVEAQERRERREKQYGDRDDRYR